jgi:nuclear inhibitor of protein phosphatase 1
MQRFGLDRFKTATTVEPFSVTQKVGTVPQQQPTAAAAPQHYTQQVQVQPQVNGNPAAAPPVSTTSYGGGCSTWQPPDWATHPKTLDHWLDVMKDGEVVDKITLDRKRLIFGRQQVMCDLVLDHPSVSRQHAAVVPHKNGGYVLHRN